MTLLAFYSTYKVRTHEHDCQNGHIFGFVTFLIFLHNATLFGRTIYPRLYVAKLDKFNQPNFEDFGDCF